MVVPVNKLFMAMFRYANRPLNRMVKSAIKSRTSPTESPNLLIRGIMLFGQKAYKLENFMTKSIVKDENVLIAKGGKDEEVGETQLKPLNPDAAFNKGIDYVTELILLYGILVGFAIYEARKLYHHE